MWPTVQKKSPFSNECNLQYNCTGAEKEQDKAAAVKEE
jgi:hypothetical protein